LSAGGFIIASAKHSTGGVSAEGEKAAEKAFCRIFLKSEKLKWGRGNKSVGLCFQKSQCCWERSEPFSLTVSTESVPWPFEKDAASFFWPLLLSFSSLMYSDFFLLKCTKVCVLRGMACGSANYCWHVVHLIMCFLLHFSTVGVLKTVFTNEPFRAVVLWLLHLPLKAEGSLEHTVIFFLPIRLVLTLPGRSIPSTSVIAFHARQ